MTNPFDLPLTTAGQDWIGGSALLWRHHHVLMHHAFTNVDGDDPDVTGDLIRFHKLTSWKGHHKWQVSLPPSPSLSIPLKILAQYTQFIGRSAA